MISALILACVAVYLWVEAKPLLQRKLGITETLASLEVEKLALEGKRVENERMALLKPTPEDADPMPQDMVEWAMNESFDWAREDKLARMRELYSKLHDWEKVRRAVASEEDAAVRNTF